MINKNKGINVVIAARLLLGGSLLFSQPLVAESYVTEIDLLDDVPLVNGATRLEQRLTEVPASVTIINREMIAASGATEIPHLLRLVPGFLSYSVFGGQFGVSARGISPEFPGHLEIMLNGRTAYQPALETMEWSTLGVDIKDIEYIEVVRGSNAPAYGSNAFLGAINIITIDPVTAPRASVRTTAGSLDTRDVSASFSNQIQDFSYSVTLSSRSNNGFPDIDRRRDDLSSKYLRLSGLYTPTLDDEVNIFLGVSQSDIERARRDRRGYHVRQVTSNYQQMKWKHLLDHGELTLNAQHSYSRINDDTALGLASTSYGRTPAQILAQFGKADEVLVSDIRGGFSERYELEAEHAFNVVDDFHAIWGTGVRLDRLKSEFLLGDDNVIDEYKYRVFGNFDWRFHPQWNANVGVMIENNNLVGTFASPRAGLNYQLSPAHMLRASVTSTKRAPSILDVNQNQSVTFADGTVIDEVITNNGRAKAERLEAVELGYLGYFLNSDLSVDIKIFYEEARDVRHFPLQAASDINGFVFVRENGLAWNNQGFEAQLKYRISNQWLFSGQYAYSDIDGFSPEDISDQIPRHNVSFLAAYRPTPSWELSSVLYHTSEMTWPRGSAIDKITRVDFRLAKKIKVDGWQGQFELIAHNLGGDYFDYSDKNHFERRLFIRLKFDLD